jgi:hypothetical protein
MPFDLDAALAEREPRVPFEFVWGGETYSLPASPNLLAFSRLTSGVTAEAYRALKTIFGDDQYDRLEANPKVFDGPALAAFMEAYAEHADVDLGEASASPPPSNRMVRRSRRTSNGSTVSPSRISARPA